MNAIALALSLFSLALGALTLVEVGSAATVPLVWPKFLSNAWAPYLALAGAAGTLLGLIGGSPVAVVAGLAGCLLSVDHLRRVTADHDRLSRAFGGDWRERLEPGVVSRFLPRRWSWRVPKAPPARVIHDLAFATVPGTTRKLTCDLWQPAAGVAPSGMAIVYLHGSAWYLLDKDVGTRTFFRHLAAQGHVVMDVAYRLCPETDIFGMVADAKRAVAWMREHAKEYGAGADQVVLMGGSAGAHVALLAAYTPEHPQLTPPDLRGSDPPVRAVVSYYGVPDMRAYERNARRFLPRKPRPELARKPPLTPAGERMCKLLFGRVLPPDQVPPPPPHPQMMRELLGGTPEQVPERFALASPVLHVGPASPPTLSFQGTHDQIIPLASTRDLEKRLARAGVPAVFIEYPRTGHAFDLLTPPLLAPAGQSALYDLERFLACVARLPVTRSEHAPTLAAA